MEEHALQPPDEFPFPFQPYSIQEDFMHALYVTLERGKLGIFESPTGTVSIWMKFLLHVYCFKFTPD